MPLRIFSLRQLAAAFAERIDERRHHAGRAAGRRGDDEMAARVLFRSRQRVRGDDADAALLLVLVVHGALVDVAGLGLQLDRPGQDALGGIARPVLTMATIALSILSMNALISASLLPETATSLAITTCATESLFFVGVRQQFLHRRVRILRLRPSSAARSPSTR